MGISTEQWRTKIGAFLPVIRSMSCRQRRVWPQRKRVRTYKRPPDEPKTHHVTMAIFICLLAIALACLTSSEDPLKDIRLEGGDLVALNGLVMYLGVSHKKALGTWQERLTIALRMALFVLLLMCGDVESNPGPSGSEKPEVPHCYVRVVDRLLRDITPISLTGWWMRIQTFIQSRSDEPSTIKHEIGKLTQRGMSQVYSTSIRSSRRLAMVAILMTLISFAHIRLERSGDVELNPGPKSHCIITEVEFLDLAKAIDPKMYIDVGVHLGIDSAELDRIRMDRVHDIKAAFMAVFRTWRDKQGEDTDMRTIFAERLCSVGLNAYADRLLSGCFQSAHGPSSIAGKYSRALTPEQVRDIRKDLQYLYRTQLCKIKTDPTDFGSLVELKEMYTNLTLVNHTTGKQRTLEYNDLLNIDNNGDFMKRILVEGEAGAGKTTLCSKIAWDWLIGDQFQQFELVIEVPLRETIHNQTVGEFVKAKLSDSNTAQAEQIDAFILSNPTKVFLILDGLDEFVGNLMDPKSNTQIVQIVQSRRFMSCLVLITTRPWKADTIRNNVCLMNEYAFVRVEGFNKENLSSYIRKYFGTDESKANDLILFMGGNDMISENMAPYPLYSAMLCVMWKEIDLKRIEAIRKLQTFSELFQEMVFFLKEHYILKLPIHTLDENYQRVEDHLMEISKIALDELLNNRLIIPEDVFCKNREAMVTGCNVGVLSREELIQSSRKERAANRHRIMYAVSFPHKLFQEYLAGLHLASLYTSDRKKYDTLIEKVALKSPKEFRYLLYFTVYQSKDVGLDILVRMSQLAGHLLTDIIADVAFECHDRDIADKVEDILSSSSNALRVNKDKSAHTISGLLFVMKHAVEISVKDRECGLSVSRDLAEAVCSSLSLQRVDIIRASFHDDFFSILANKSSFSKLQHHPASSASLALGRPIPQSPLVPPHQTPRRHGKPLPHSPVRCPMSQTSTQPGGRGIRYQRRSCS